MEQARLRELFDVDLDGGRLYWRAPPTWHPRLVGREAGGPRNSSGGKRYWVVKADGRAWKRGRLIFLAVHGRLPEPCVDHIDGESLNDRPANLREASVEENNWNHKRRARRLPLPMGVRLTPGGRFQARIAHRGRLICLGSFDTPADAQATYQAKRRELYGEFA